MMRLVEKRQWAQSALFDDAGGQNFASFPCTVVTSVMSQAVGSRPKLKSKEPDQDR